MVKLYLSPILDLYNGEIIAYNIEHRPTYSLVSKMLNKAFQCLNDKETYFTLGSRLALSNATISSVAKT